MFYNCTCTVQGNNFSETTWDLESQNMNSMKLVIPLHSLYWSIPTKDESNRICFHLWCELTLALWSHCIVWSLFP